MADIKQMDIPPVDRAGIAKLTAEAAAGPQTSSSGSGQGKLRPLLPNDGPRIIGQPGGVTCQDCGAEVERVLNTEFRNTHIWEMPEHTCPEREARLAAVREGQARELEAWLRNPPAARVAEVRRLARLPYWTPAGVDKLHAGTVRGEVLTALEAHRAAWAAGRRPEKGLWLWGPTNRRKTAGLCALLFDVTHRTRKNVCFWNFENLMDHLRREAGGRKSQYDAVQVENADLLCLDDIGTLKFTEKAWETLYALVNNANDCWGSEGPAQTLYVSSNESPAEVGRMLATDDRPDGGHRIVRRLLQLCEVIEA